MRNSGRTLVYDAYARDKFFISYGHATIRWHTLVYFVIRRTCPKILCMHKISNVCRRIDYTLDKRKTYATHTLCIRSRTLHISYSYANKRCNTLKFVGRLLSV